MFKIDSCGKIENTKLGKRNNSLCCILVTMCMKLDTERSNGVISLLNVATFWDHPLQYNIVLITIRIKSAECTNHQKFV